MQANITSRQNELIAARRVPDNCIFVGGQCVKPEGADANAIPLINPATEEVIGTCANASAEDVNKAVENAHEAFESGVWSKRNGNERGAVLRKIGQLMRENRDLLAGLDVLNCGKPTSYALFDVDSSADLLDYYAEIAENDEVTRVVPLTNAPGYVGKEKRFPRGVVGVITPWNFPLKMALWKSIPALASGNTVVLKPSEVAPWSCLEFALLCKEGGLPDGVFNVVIGSGKDTGVALSHHDKISYLAFTGSLFTGKKIMHAASDHVIPVTLELGGKSPLIVCKDADLSLACKSAAFGIFFNQGEACTAASRLLIEEDVYEEVLKGVIEEAKKIVSGNGLQENVNMGPLVSKPQYEKVLQLIQTGFDEGLNCVFGGLPKETGKGYFVPPTIFTNAETTNTLWKEEVFGPVLITKTFRTKEEALALANATEYGLGSGVFSTNRDTLDYFADNIEAGMCSLNTYHFSSHELPWIGWKHSGLGIGLATHGYYEYTRLKQVAEYVGTA
ncbi:aldehyde dehydrogenase Meu8 [Schizosaccharomyces octosporus yFS286]|uniref:Aldehyde dehydrogenase Meu8 n=1 Tax=Schizosaccharomyces octosporus (strain yFS286) TaxID=483514 RepID=S9QXC4_SCHOY|nr:aldehyde dehydrogenase Meu8 [Schizosaccharomyces octosporus yFS286]EPX70955.1 aldehyde dehydrogenase Meu8 [Schizosaccharomyces octosporus yFS286]